MWCSRGLSLLSYGTTWWLWTSEPYSDRQIAKRSMLQLTCCCYSKGSVKGKLNLSVSWFTDISIAPFVPCAVRGTAVHICSFGNHMLGNLEPSIDAAFVKWRVAGVVFGVDVLRAVVDAVKSRFLGRDRTHFDHYKTSFWNILIFAFYHTGPILHVRAIDVTELLLGQSQMLIFWKMSPVRQRQIKDDTWKEWPSEEQILIEVTPVVWHASRKVVLQVTWRNLKRNGMQIVVSLTSCPSRAALCRSVSPNFLLTARRFSSEESLRKREDFRVSAHLTAVKGIKVSCLSFQRPRKRADDGLIQMFLSGEDSFNKIVRLGMGLAWGILSGITDSTMFMSSKCQDRGNKARKLERCLVIGNFLAFDIGLVSLARWQNTTVGTK